MKLYDMQMAPNPRRVRVFLAEKDIDNVELVPVDIAKREHKADDYIANINRMGQVPTLELDDGTHISESMAICRYFEEVQPDPPLFGRDAVEKAQVEMWSRRAELTIMGCVAAAFRHTSDFFKGMEDQVPAWGEQNLGKLPDRFAWLDAALADREYLAGDAYSVADITAMISVDFARVVGMKVGDDWPNLSRWHAAVASRPSAKA